jgi:hypothetical protein
VSGFSTKTRSLIEGRDSKRCVCCGMPAREKHHRRRRRVDHDGMAHSPANGASFCGWGNHTGCHGKVHSNPTWAKAKGYILEPDQDPRKVPMWHFSRGWVVMDEEGLWESVPVGGGAPVDVVLPPH